MSQTTTNRGRGSVATPDLGYDTLDGGTALAGVVNTLWTWFSDHVVTRYYALSLANNASQTITHNFGLNLSALKLQVWESAALRTDAQVATDYTITNVGTSSFTFQNTSGGSKTLWLVVRAGKLGINSGDFDAACAITSTGTATFAGIQQSGDTGIIFNSSTTGTGANWKSTLVRDTSGMTANATITLPKATATLATLGLAETLALKTLTGVAGITLAAAASLDWAAGNAAVGASIGANTLTIAGSSSTVRFPGAVSCGTLATDSDDLVLNNDAAGSSADWKATIRRPASGMAAAAVHTLPAATTTLVGTDQAQVLTLKDIDGGTASNTSRLTVPKAATATLAALTRKAGTIVYDTTLASLFADNGTTLVPIGGGGGGGGMVWHAIDGLAPGALEENGELTYQFGTGLGQKLRVYMKIPSSYVAGNQIKLKIGEYSPGSSSGTILMQTVATLIRKATDAVTSTTNQRTSTNAAITVSSTANRYEEANCDLTSSTGTINSVAVAAGDVIMIDLQRGTDTDTNDIRVMPSAMEVTFQ